MASLLNFTAMSVSQQPPEFYLRGNTTPTFTTKRRANSVSFAVNSPEKPEIELEFIGVCALKSVLINKYRKDVIINNFQFITYCVKLSL